MPEKIKFTPEEIGEKQEGAQEMDKKAEKMVEEGEAKTLQEAVEKMEEKELEKSPEEMLQEALPLAWEQALKFAEENGFATSEEIKKRIDLAKKYNLEVEHFFYDPEKLEKEMPIQEQIGKTARELEYVREFAKEFSKQSQKPTFCIFNARNGTIYSYGMDALNTQLNFQFEEVAEKEERPIQELRNAVANDIKNNNYWRLSQQKEVDFLLKKIYKKRAILEVMQKLMENDKINYIIIDHKDFKISSYEFDPAVVVADRHKAEKIDSGTLAWISLCRDLLEQNLCGLMTIDASGNPRGYPLSYLGFSKVTHNIQTEGEFWYLSLRNSLLGKDDIREKVKERFEKLGDNLASVFMNAFSQPKEVTDANSKLIPWFDNFPQALGRAGIKFSHRGRDEELIYPVEKIIQSGKQIEYLSEKVKNALRYYQKDEEGRNWFERNFEGIMLGKEDAPEKDTKEYLEKFRKWVPYETDEKGEAVLDDERYPILRKDAPMAMAAEDELARLEAAMEELEG